MITVILLYAKAAIRAALESGIRGGESKTMPVPLRRLLRPRKLDAGVFGADVASFRLHLAAENKAERTIKVYTEAVR